MKKFCKRMLAVIVLCALVFTMLPTIGASAASVTKEQAVQWARSKIGKELYYDSGDMWCVDLIYYYYDYLGVPVYYGNAIDFATASAAVPAGSGWQRIPVTAGFVPQPGDIAVWKANYNWGSGWTYPEGHIGIVTCADTEGLMAVEMGHHRTPSENWFPLHAIQCVIRPNFVSSTPVSVITIQNANYPISKPNGNWFTVYGTVSSPNPLEWVQCYVTNTAGDWIFAAGWGFTPAEKAQTITTYDINALDSQMIFASLPAGTYIYHVDAYDKKGYLADIDQTFTVGNVAASSGVITQAGRHMHQNDFPGYSWGEWEVTEEATCTESGIKTRKCYCGATETKSIPSGEGHSWSDWKTTVYPSPSGNGKETRICSICESEESRVKKYDAANMVDIRVESLGNADRGDQIEVKVFIEDVPNWAATNFEVHFDPKVLEYKSMCLNPELKEKLENQNGMFSVRETDSGNGVIKLTFTSAENYSEDEDYFCAVRFNVKKDATIGDSMISLQDVGVYNAWGIDVGFAVENGIVTIEAPSLKKGDFDFDGQITVADALAALRISSRIEAETAEAIEIGDIDADGTITVADALAILRVAARIEDSF